MLLSERNKKLQYYFGNKFALNLSLKIFLSSNQNKVQGSKITKMPVLLIKNDVTGLSK